MQNYTEDSYLLGLVKRHLAGEVSETMSLKYAECYVNGQKFIRSNLPKGAFFGRMIATLSIALQLEEANKALEEGKILRAIDNVGGDFEIGGTVHGPTNDALNTGDYDHSADAVAYMVRAAAHSRPIADDDVIINQITNF